MKNPLLFQPRNPGSKSTSNYRRNPNLCPRLKSFPFLFVGAGIGAVIYGFLPEKLLQRLAGPNNPFATLVASFYCGANVYSSFNNNPD